MFIWAGGSQEGGTAGKSDRLPDMQLGCSKPNQTRHLLSETGERLLGAGGLFIYLFIDLYIKKKKDEGGKKKKECGDSHKSDPRIQKSLVAVHRSKTIESNQDPVAVWLQAQ